MARAQKLQHVCRIVYAGCLSVFGQAGSSFRASTVAVRHLNLTPNQDLELDMGGRCQNCGPLLGSSNTWCRIILKDPKRDHHFDNHPYSKVRSELCEAFLTSPPEVRKMLTKASKTSRSGCCFTYFRGPGIMCQHAHAVVAIVVKLLCSGSRLYRSRGTTVLLTRQNSDKPEPVREDQRRYSWRAAW